MKRFVAFVVILAVTCVFSLGCGGETKKTPPKTEKTKTEAPAKTEAPKTEAKS
jgi:hypothetical protein